MNVVLSWTYYTWTWTYRNKTQINFAKGILGILQYYYHIILVFIWYYVLHGSDIIGYLPTYTNWQIRVIFIQDLFR